jgi:hypothetical protein
LKRSPTEAFLLHFYKICSIGGKNHRKLYNKYRDRFYEALAFFTISLSQHKTALIQWIKKFVRSSVIDTLKIPDSYSLEEKAHLRVYRTLSRFGGID